MSWWIALDIGKCQIQRDQTDADAPTTQSDALLVTLCVGISNFVWLPLLGSLSDRVGRRPLLLFSAGTAILTAYPAMAWLVDHPTFAKLLIVEL